MKNFNFYTLCLVILLFMIQCSEKMETEQKQNLHGYKLTKKEILDKFPEFPVDSFGISLKPVDNLETRGDGGPGTINPCGNNQTSCCSTNSIMEPCFFCPEGICFYPTYCMSEWETIEVGYKSYALAMQIFKGPANFGVNLFTGIWPCQVPTKYCQYNNPLLGEYFVNGQNIYAQGCLHPKFIDWRCDHVFTVRTLIQYFSEENCQGDILICGETINTFNWSGTDPLGGGCI
jgi:hypothetical protein